MPIIQINMWEGRSKEIKRTLIKAVSKATADTLEIPVERVQVIINNVSKDDWGIKGDQASEVK
ncbi:MAG: 2-hydroxymuconate tautomerase family protein [Candidatus Komeilibacteria bacterium]|nr:2-hydroxymuconate tautomerase family protein [Candidatus Komeilibacteria bacterium]